MHFWKHLLCISDILASCSKLQVVSDDNLDSLEKQQIKSK